MSGKQYEKDRDKMIARAKLWNANNPEKVKKYQRKHQFKVRYDIDEDWYQKKLAEQGGHCALCPRVASGKRRLAVDHDHRTGIPRGLLCTQHNTGLGKFGDDIEQLRAAISYLQAYRDIR